MSSKDEKLVRRSAFSLLFSGLWSVAKASYYIFRGVASIIRGIFRMMARLLRLSQNMRLKAMRKGGAMVGKCWVFGEDVNTDEIIPARYLNMTDPAALAEHCMEDADQEFVKKAAAGDIIVAGKNFGCGSSREHAPLAVKAFGIACVIAPSFARIFFRNAINIGLPIVECAEAVADVQEGDELRVSIQSAEITNLRTGRTYEFEPFPEEMQQIIKSGGLMNFVQKELK